MRPAPRAGLLRTCGPGVGEPAARGRKPVVSRSVVGRSDGRPSPGYLIYQTIPSYDQPDLLASATYPEHDLTFEGLDVSVDASVLGFGGTLAIVFEAIQQGICAKGYKRNRPRKKLSSLSIARCDRASIPGNNRLLSGSLAANSSRSNHLDVMKCPIHGVDCQHWPAIWDTRETA